MADGWSHGLEYFEVGADDPEYPAHLRESPDPPPRLYGVGDVATLRMPGLAVVGARKATPYGLSGARRFAGWAAQAGYPIVSGAARGCDQAAHRSALDVGGTTVAVLGCGADIAYPSDAQALLRAIAASGCVVSELPWGHPPAKWTFRARNRIIAGLAGALLVLEANVPSGTFVTADNALAAGREVLVVPGSILAPECRGPNRLLRQGATPITDVSELAQELRACLGEPCNLASGSGTDVEARATRDRILSALRTDPARPDDLARILELDIVDVARRIGALEAGGMIAKYPNGRYGPC